MSAWGHKLTMRLQFATSAIPPKPDIAKRVYECTAYRGAMLRVADTKTRRGAGCDECVALRCVALR